MSNNSYYNDAWRIINEKNQSLVSNYSMEFDGTNDVINCGLNAPFNAASTNFSISLWCKSPNSFTDSGNLVESRLSFANPDGIAIEFISNSMYFRKSGSTVGKTITEWGLNNTNWNNIVYTYDLTLAGNKIFVYINGVLLSSTPQAATSQPASTGDFTIGDGLRGNFNGSIDQVSVFDYTLSSSQVATLYGGGTAITNPMSLSPKPISYYQLGDQSVDNGANYLVPNNSLNGIEGYSPYALSLDSNDANYFTLNNGGGNGLLNAATSLTISAWINIAATSTFQNIFTRFFGGVMFRVLGTNGNLQLYLTREDNTYLLIQALNAVSFNEWQHLAATWDGSTVKLYVNNVEVKDASFSDTLKNDTSNNSDLIGNRVGTTQYFNGKISNVAIWKNTVIDVTTLYNQGVPADLTSLNPSGWWQMGSNSSFDANTSKWTCLNEGTARTSTVPSNATTFAGNMTEDNIVNGVGYSGNGLGTSSIEIVGDAPYSTANGISENMDVLDRTTDLPPTV